MFLCFLCFLCFFVFFVRVCVRALRNTFTRPTDHLELRLRYLLGEITEAQARASLLRKWKMRDKRNMLNIYEVVLAVLTECMRMIVQYRYVTDDVHTRRLFVKQGVKVLDEGGDLLQDFDALLDE
jgi:hypothetical protein